MSAPSRAVTVASELRQLAQAATEGPWYVNDGYRIDTLPEPEGTDDLPEDEWRAAWDPWSEGVNSIGEADPENAALIVWLANRREPIAALIEAAEAITTMCDDWPYSAEAAERMDALARAALAALGSEARPGESGTP